MCVCICIKAIYHGVLLQSLALVDRGSGPDTICLLRVDDLSEDTQERFNHLFTLREKWAEADITPYIKLVLLNMVFKRITEFLNIFPPLDGTKAQLNGSQFSSAVKLV